MIAFNRVTRQVVKNLDPSDSSDAYYSLDKRQWEFIEEYSRRYYQVIQNAKHSDFISKEDL